MKRKYIFPLITSLLVLGSCDYVEDNFEGIEQFDHPTNVFTKDYTLTAEDYTSIADLSANKNLAQSNGVEDQLSALKTSMAFTDELPASDYLPAFLMDKWYTGDEGSAIRVTYNNRLPYTSTERAINAATMYTVSADDYLAAWEGVGNNFFTPSVSASRFVPQILSEVRPQAQEGEMVLVDYDYSASEPTGAAPALDEDFEGFWSETVYTAEVPGWQNVVTIGTYAWSGRIYSGNAYLQQSSYGHKAGELESYMITPKISVKSGMSLTFDACYGNYKEEGGRISLLYIEASQLSGFDKETVAAANWVDITDAVEIPVPSGTYGTLGNVCDYDLSSLAGKDIYIAFRYNGDNKSATTTVQIDNVVVKASSAGEAVGLETTAMSDLFRYDGSQWQPYNDALSLDGADYKAMGSNYGNLSNTMLPDNYLPVYLSQTYPYAQEDDAYTIAYKYYDGETTTVQCSSYTYRGGAWQPSALTVVTDQFVLSGGEWCYNPSTTITLEVGKGIEASSTFYQLITDWVADNYPEYVTGYGNNDYYYGGSAYQNNFDFRADKWREQGTYNDLSNDEITNLMWERLPEAFPHALEVLYADVAPIEGIQIIYTINFGIYDGKTTTMWTIQYEVTGVGTFTYVEDSLKKQG